MFRFGDVELDAGSGLVRRNGHAEYLRWKSAEVLLSLIRNRPRVVPKEELAAEVWRDVVTTEDALVGCVMEIRKALGDDPKSPRYVRTVSKVGYQFIAEAEELAVSPPSPAARTLREEVSVEVEVRREVEEPDPERKALTRVRGARARVLLLAVIASVLALAAAAFALRRPPVSTSVARVPGRKALAVLLFDNQSASVELDWLRAGLTDMVISDLSASGGVEVLSRQQLALVLERVRSPGKEPLSLEKAVEVAKRSGAEAFVMGGFTRIGDRVRIQVQLHDASNGALLAAESATAERPELIFSSVDRLAGRLVSRLTPARAPGSGLAAAMTGNLEAFRLYSVALDEMQGLHTREAIDLLTKAAALDPEFVMARARIGYVYAVIWDDPDRGRHYLEEAFRESSRLTENDRAQIAAWYSIAKRDFPSAIRAYRALVRSSPKDLESTYRLAELLSGEARWDEALAVARQGLAADPESGELHNLLAASLADLGRYDEALAAARRYVELEPAEPNARDTFAGVLQRIGRYDEAIAAYREALRLAPEFEIAVVHLGNALLATGRVTEALEAYRRYVALADSDPERHRGMECLAAAQLRRGHLEDAERELSGYDSGGVGGIALRIALERRDFAAARKTIGRSYENRPPNRGRRETGRLRAFDEGMLALRFGESGEALDRFAEALRHRPPYWHFDTFEDCLANAELELHRFDEAIAEYERILRANPSYPLARYHLGLAYEGKGEKARARVEWTRFLESWKNADADLPEIVDAKSRLGRPS